MISAEQLHEIGGWLHGQPLDESVSQLSLGERAMISIPSSKAFGSKGFPCLVPKDSDLRWDVELLNFTS